ncbi:MAG: hypothetical protein A2521_14105 [Deltaproteobacteria bacterium RIFOXYD12_FULL_57_12]|nr:MAG: hypothetical protein A2521_14105 [Deltaproteobacteria bacterium RIFOXYD12_FULL_57_12]
MKAGRHFRGRPASASLADGMTIAPPDYSLTCIQLQFTVQTTIGNRDVFIVPARQAPPCNWQNPGRGNHMHRAFFAYAMACLVCLLPTIGCQKAAEPIPVIRIGHAPHDHHAPLYVAAMNPEYFQKHGGIFLKEITFRQEYELVADNRTVARLLISSSPGGQELLRKLNEDQFDLVFGGVPAMIDFIDQGSAMRILAPAMTEGAGLVVGKELAAGSWPEFVEYVRASKTPVRIGYKNDVSVQNLIFEYGLREVGITYGKGLDAPDVKVALLNLRGEKNLIPALRDGLIDGFVINQPYMALAEQQGVGKYIASLNELPPAGRWHGTPCCAVAGNTSSVAAQPKAMEALLTLLLRANRFLTENQKTAAGQVARWLDLPVEVEEKSLPTINFTVDFDKDWDRGVNFWIESMIQADLLQGSLKEAYQTGHLNERLYDRALFDQVRNRL